MLEKKHTFIESFHFFVTNDNNEKGSDVSKHHDTINRLTFVGFTHLLPTN